MNEKERGLIAAMGDAAITFSTSLNALTASLNALTALALPEGAAHAELLVLGYTEDDIAAITHLAALAFVPRMQGEATEGTPPQIINMMNIPVSQALLAGCKLIAEDSLRQWWRSPAPANGGTPHIVVKRRHQHAPGFPFRVD